MATNLKTAIFAAMMTMTALSAAAEVNSPIVANDPLMKQIMSHQLTQMSGGVTGAVRIGSGQAITLSLIDPLAPLKPAEGLVAKPVKMKAHRKLNDQQLLKKLSDEKRAVDWPGRK